MVAEDFPANGAGVCRIPEDAELDWEEVALLVRHTENTWQKNRRSLETERDTVQGKRAECAFERFVRANTGVRYLSYDSFREDGFKSHAPFDGLLYRNTVPQETLEYYLSSINREVDESGTSGRISPKLRSAMEEAGIFTMEVKSSVLKDTLGDFKGTSGRVPRIEKDCRQIVNNMERWDFFVYPHYLRSSESVSNFYDYTEYVRNHWPQDFSDLSNEKFLRRLMHTEFDHASDVYTRVYFDYAGGRIYIPGYVMKEDFFRKPNIGHMPGGKSGNALYYMYSIANRRSFYEMDQDDRIWNFNQEVAYTRLLAGTRPKCSCGKDLFICNSRQNRSYFYKCFGCGKTYDFP